MRYLTTFTLIIVFLILSNPVNAVSEVRSISFPAVSADGNTVYFCAWGDIWSAPRDGSEPARRLTDNVALESRPMPSPDGSTIAFMTDRYGNYDIFTMPAEGGKSTRLTWDSYVDYPYDWKSDSSAILAYTKRQDHWALCAYEINLDGSPPVRISGPDHDDHVFPSYMGDDNHMIYTRGPGDWAKKGWVGSNTYDLWVYDINKRLHAQLTDNDVPDLWPQSSPDGSVIYFVRPVKDCYNLWSFAFGSREYKQLTNFTKNGPLWPRISPDGDEICFEVHGEAFIYDIASGKTEKIEITFADDPKHEMVVDADLYNNVSEFKISPNGKYYAYVVLGDIFILKNSDIYKEDEKPAQDLTMAHMVVDSPGRDFQVAWHPEDLKLAYVSDRDGQFDVYVLDLITMEEKRLTKSKVDEYYPTFAPHGDKLAYYSGNRELKIYDLDDEKEELLYKGQIIHGPWALGFEWSPDANWIAFVEGTIDSNADVLIINLEDKKPINVSFEPDYCSSPSWSPDGKYLTFHVSYEDGAEVMLLELDPEEETYDTQMLFADDIPEEPAEEEEKVEEDGDEKSEEVDEEKTEEKPAAEEEDEEEKVEPIKINFDRITKRARPIVRWNGSQYSPMFSPNSDYIIFVTNHEGSNEWWSVTVEGNELNKLGSAVSKDYPQFSSDGKKLYFLEGQRITFLNMSGSKANGGGAVTVQSRMQIDQYEIWDQMLVEGWRRLLHGFYDKDMHGVDWKEVLERYRPRVKDCGTTYEFNRLYRLMLGELKASHLSFYSPDNNREAPAENTGELGVIFDEKWDGPGWKVNHVLLNSPADQPGSKLYPGDVILEIDGKEVNPGDNRSKIFRNMVGIPMKFKVRNDKRVIESEENNEPVTLLGDPEFEERDVVIKPTNYNALWTYMYNDWAEENREYVYEKTDSKIGYQHIRSMYGSPYLEDFRRDLFTESMDKEALIIDVRFNTGGRIAADILDILMQEPFYLHRIRDGELSTRPALTWDGPIVVLINAHSFSNAEIFGHILRDFNKATIIGETTGGGVIGTYDFSLMDGSNFRMPAWWNARLNGNNMEGNGVIPDIYIHIDPNTVQDGNDNQLDAAIEYLLDKIR